MTHGWPGSVIELLETVGPLTDPTAHGGTAGGRIPPGAAVLARLRLFRRARRARLGCRPHRTRVGGADEAPRLHPLRRPGRRRGRARHGRDGPPGARGSGRHPPQPARGGARSSSIILPKASEQERAAHAALATFTTDGFGYFHEQATRPQTIGYALLDSPVGLAAWMLDHDTDSYTKISRAFVDGKPVGGLTRESIVDNITLYWLTGTAASAARSYWETARALAAALRAGKAPPPVTVPVGFTTFPGEICPGPAQLGRDGLPRPRLLQRGRQGRPLRRLGGAGALLSGGARGVQHAALSGGMNLSTPEEDLLL